MAGLLTKPWATLSFTKHAIQQMSMRMECDRDTAINYMANIYSRGQIVYESKTHPGQLKIQDDRFVLCYEPVAHLIVTVFVNGFLQDDKEFARLKRENAKKN
tara:strand:+ start:181 stop:486 length:306 start_codon:yes stop_codon:yes gene_type:complete